MPSNKLGPRAPAALAGMQLDRPARRAALHTAAAE